MSLLHQVLKDIDQRTEPVTVAVPSLQLHAPSSVFSGWLPVGVLLTALTMIGWFFWSANDGQNSALSVAEYAAPRVAAEDRATSAALVQPPVTHPSLTQVSLVQPTLASVVTATAEKPDQTVKAAEHPSAVADVPRATPVALHQVKEDSPSASVATQPQPAAENKTIQAAATVSSPATGVIVERRQDNAHTAYVGALNALKNKHYAQALSQIEQALATDKNPAYQALKLRIFLEEKNSDQFIAYFRQHADNRHEHWLAVAAPGLHMLGHPELAVAPYQQLIVLQPEVVNWPLALASAWEDQTKPAPAVAVLKNVIAHYRLTPSQKQWVVRKIEVLGGQSRS